jgi:hypothetical protein
MKKTFILIIFCFSYYFINAQELGIRFGKVAGNDVAIDAVFSAGEFSRIHADLSFGHGLGLDALYDFIYKPLGSGFSWYVGAGPTMLIDDPFFLGISGELGLDYHFEKVPISISGDWRPTFYIIEDTDFDADGFGINVRWVFGK